MRNQEMYDELLELIRIDAATGKERAIATAVTQKLEALGFAVTEDKAGESFGGECGNLLAVREGELPGSLLLCSHLDRVGNGFGIKPVERDGVLYSDGTTILAVDDVSGICAIFEGLRRVLASGKPLPRLEVLFSVGEEGCMLGSRAMDTSVLQSKIGYIFDSPGPVGRFVCGAPGAYILKGAVTGKPAHAGNEPEKGINAAKVMCEILATIRQGRLDAVSTANFPILRTGSTGTNVVCDKAEFEGEARSRDHKKLQDYVDYFQSHCKEVAEKYGAGVETVLDPRFLPFWIEESEPVLAMARQACDSLGLTFKAEPGGGAFDGCIFNAKGMSCVGVATGYSKNHTKDEQLILEDYFKSGELCAVLIELYAESVKG